MSEARSYNDIRNEAIAYAREHNCTVHFIRKNIGGRRHYEWAMKGRAAQYRKDGWTLDHFIKPESKEETDPSTRTRGHG